MWVRVHEALGFPECDPADTDEDRGSQGTDQERSGGVLSCSGGLAVTVGTHPVSFDASGGAAAGAFGEAPAPPPSLTARSLKNSDNSLPRCK